MQDKDFVTKKLAEIANIIVENNFQENIGLLSGAMGEALFLFHYDKFNGENRVYNRGIELIEIIFKTINGGNLQTSFCNGLAGVGWGIEYLIENNFIEEDIRDSLTEIDDLIGEMMVNEMANGHFDYLHGASGNVLYLLRRRQSNSSKIDSYLKRYLEFLDRSSEVSQNNSLKWSSIVDSRTNKLGYNISLSHGIASIIVILSKLYINQIEKDHTLCLAEKSVNYLLEQRVDKSKLHSYFPTFSIESNSVILPENLQSRLSWCYGDVGISAALWQSGKNFCKKEWMALAVDIALKSTYRPLNNTGVVDAGICHGASGLCHIYNKFFINTGNKRFFKASQFWLHETLRMAKFNDGLAGYKFFDPSKQGNWINETNLLNGICGIGMAMLSSKYEMNNSWDESLLLS